MKKIGLTGGIGSGKSYVAEIFHHLGVPVFNSDDVARDLQTNNKNLIAAIAEAFPGVLTEEHGLNRKRLAEIVFNDSSKLAQLNAIVHPAVGKAFDEFCVVNSNAPYVIKEAAIIFETGLDEMLDSTIVVTAPEQLRIQRVMSRDKVTESEVRARMNRQWSEEQKAERADWIIVNDGERALIPQAVKIHEQIKAL
jgi:dephospho-CoA kinase